MLGQADKLEDTVEEFGETDPFIIRKTLLQITEFRTIFSKPKSIRTNIPNPNKKCWSHVDQYFIYKKAYHRLEHFLKLKTEHVYL